jgi:hypothetical protein
MKKAIFTFIPIFLFIMGCVTGRATSSNVANVPAVDELDPAIREASTYLNTRIPQGRKAVFLNITSDYPDLSEYILSLLSENAVNDGIFSVVDRAQLDALRAEMNFQLSGEVDDNSAQAIGKLLGAETIVSGAANKIGSLYRFQVKAIEVQTASVQGQWSKTVNGGGAIIAALTEKLIPASRISPVVATVPAVTPSSGSSGTTQAATSTTTISPIILDEPRVPVITYKIVDTGPAGGIVFYDKGDNEGGWRYLEAAPVSTEFQVKWSVNGSEVDGTRTEIGTGKRNTQLIIDTALRRGEDMPAARLCDRLAYGGYNDWFLPSKSELGLMYLNLHTEGLGGFLGERYWSSSQVDTPFWSSGNIWWQRFGDGIQDYTRDVTMNNEKSSSFRVRAIRQF